MKYTHHAKFYGIPAYFNENNYDLSGINIFYDIICTIIKFYDLIGVLLVKDYNIWANIEIGDPIC